MQLALLTREEIAAIDRECEQQHVSQQEYLDSHGIAKHQYYRWKRRYKEEDEQSLVPAGFVPMMPGTDSAPTMPRPKSKGRQNKSQDQESFLTVEIRSSDFRTLRGPEHPQGGRAVRISPTGCLQADGG